MLPIGIRIKNARKKEGYTQLDLAFLAGIDYNTLKKIETGITINPSSSLVGKIAYALAIPLEDLIQMCGETVKSDYRSQEIKIDDVINAKRKLDD